MPHYFEHLDLTATSWCVSSSHACAAGVRTAPETLHACYCHTPMRYVWMPEQERNRVSGVKGAALRALRGRLRRLDRRASERPDVYVANSTAVADRIKRFYGREAVVVPPPVAVDDFPRDVPRDPTRFLWVHRLVAYKRPLEVAEAFRELPDLRLTMVGLGPLEAELRARLPPNVELLGWVPQGAPGGAVRRRGGLHPRGRGGLRHLDGRGAGRRRAGARRRRRRGARHRAPRARRVADRRPDRPAADPRPACASWPSAAGTPRSCGAAPSASRRSASASAWPRCCAPTARAEMRRGAGILAVLALAAPGCASSDEDLHRELLRGAPRDDGDRHPRRAQQRSRRARPRGRS